MTREMKNSGVEWIGDIPCEWKIIKSKYIFANHKEIVGDRENNFERLSLTLNGVLKRPKDDSKGLQSESLSTYQVLYKDELVFKMIDLENTSTSRVGYSPYTGLVSPVYIVFNNNKYSKYGFWYFYNLWQRNIYNTLGNNGVRSALNASDMLNLPFIQIPNEEQTRISDFLDSKVTEIDKIVSETKASIENYKEYKQSVITEAVTKGLDKNVPMKDSGIEWIGKVPDHWNVNTIKNVATTCSGGTPNSSDTSLFDGDINWMCSYDLKEKPIFASGRKITQKGADTIAGKMQGIGSILIAMYGGSGTIGNSGILECEARTNQAICSVKFNNQYIMDYYGFYYILAIRKYWMIYAVGTRKDPNISQDTVRRMPCVIPPLKEQELVIKYLDSKCVEIDNLISEKETLVSNLEEYKKSLIYEYVTGKKTV